MCWLWGCGYQFGIIRRGLRGRGLKGDELAFFLNSSCLKKQLINLREELIDESRELTHSEQNEGNVTDSKYQVEAGSTNT